MSSVQRLVDYHIARLQDKRPAVRLDAIRELVLLESLQSLEALQQVYLNDEDAEVRKSAQEAGRTIYKANLPKNDETQNPDRPATTDPA